jgi:hypothetical protein
MQSSILPSLERQKKLPLNKAARDFERNAHQPGTALWQVNLLTIGRAIIDDMHYVSQTKYGSVKLLASVHRIKWAVIFGVSVMVDAKGYAAYEKISNINLEAGHRYTLRADRMTGQGYKVFFWIEDMTAGKIVSGEKKP